MLSKVEWTTTGRISVTRWIQKTYDNKKVNSQKGLMAYSQGLKTIKVKDTYLGDSVNG